jgi:hypothetical protein
MSNVKPLRFRVSTEITGRELLGLVEQLGELEWAKFETRQPTIETRFSITVEDRSTHPPYASFRFKVESLDLIQRLQAAVSSYRGPISWVMSSHSRAPLPSTNWIIQPKLAADSEEKASEFGLPLWRYMKENFPTYGPACYQDLPVFVEHVRRSILVSPSQPAV